MKLTPHFTTDEVKCPCCGVADIDMRLMWKLEDIRAMLGMPMTITSGYRCPAHNKAVGGQEQSMHLCGKAVDILCKDSAHKFLLLRAAFVVGMHGVGIAKDFIHLDCRDLPGKVWLY